MPYIYRPEKIAQIIDDTNLSEDQLFKLLSKQMPDAGMMVLIVGYALDGSSTETKSILKDMKISAADIDALINREKGTEEGFNKAVGIINTVSCILPSHIARLMRASKKNAFEIAAWMNEMEPYLIELDSENKVRSYFDDLSKTKKFQAAISAIRVKYGIPRDGFTDIDEWWEYEESNPDKKEGIEREARRLVAKYEFGPEWLDNFIFFINHDALTVDRWPFYSLLGVEDERALKYGTGNVQEGDMLNASRPISIRISPYATKRDILEFVEKMYTFTIFEAQSKYRNPESQLLRVRSRDEKIQERNVLVYKYKDLPYKEILKKLPPDMRGTLDEGSVGKIISDEKKRRN